MEYNALIQWNDTKNFEDVIITTNKATDRNIKSIEDDYIFFYFKDVDEIEEYRKIGVDEFRIVSYLPTKTRDWYHKLRSPKHTDENTGDQIMFV